jgi:hypothetical protein
MSKITDELDRLLRRIRALEADLERERAEREEVLRRNERQAEIIGGCLHCILVALDQTLDEGRASRQPAATMTCPNCRGERVEQGPNGEPIFCPYCGGGGVIPSAPTEEPPRCEFAADGHAQGTGAWCIIHRMYCKEPKWPDRQSARNGLQREPPSAPAPQDWHHKDECVLSDADELDEAVMLINLGPCPCVPKAAPPSEPPTPVPGRSTTSINWTKLPEQALGDIVEAALSKMTPAPGKPCSRRKCNAPNPHYHCRGCRYPVEADGYCGECACEEDTID